MNAAPSVRAEGLGKHYGSLWALRDCDLSLPAEGVIALVGPNGAGKTTLMRLAAGLLLPSEGSISVFGHPAGANTPGTLAAIGFLAQEHPLYRRFSVEELIRFGEHMNEHFDRSLVEARAAARGIPVGRKAGSLSEGQQAQIALALALAKHPRLLILDEPMASLDPLARIEFLQTLMEATAADRLTVLFSSHVVSELERVCDYLVVLNSGRMALAGDIEGLLAEHRLLIGPRTTSPMVRSNVIEATHAERQTILLVRDGNLTPAPGWQAQHVGLEELVLAYLRRSPDTASSAAVSEVPREGVS